MGWKKRLVGHAEFSYAGKRGKGTPDEGKGLGKGMKIGISEVSHMLWEDRECQ